MGLIAPWFLAGLSLLALPVYLHLLRRHKATPQKFSSLMFFERSMETSVRRRRLTHLLLLALRLALLALVVFAFARPFYTTTAPAAAGNSQWVLVIDDSASMGAGRRLETAKAEALKVLGAKPARTRAQAATIDSRFRLLGEPTEKADELKALLAAVTLTDSQSSYGELANALRTYARANRQALEVHLFTDLQRSSMPPAFSALRLEPGTVLKLHNVAESDEPNWYVDEVRSPGRLLDSKRHKVEAVVAGANTPASAKTVRLMVNGKESARRQVNVPANGRAAVSFEGLEIPFGYARCEVALDGGDALPLDDRSLFAVERSDPRTVLLVGGARSERTLLYLRNALEASAPGAWRIEAGGWGTLQSGEASRYALIVLADAGAAPESAEARLKSAVETGLPVLVLAGSSSAAAGKVPVTGDRIDSTTYNARAGSRFLTATSFDLSHAALEDSNRWEGARFFLTSRIDAAGGRVLVRLSDGSPLLYEKRLGAGRVLVFASALDNVANDLPSHPAFVALADRMLDYLAGGVSGASRSVVDDDAELRSAGAAASAVEVLNPEGRRALTLADAAKAATIQLNKPGFWEIRRPGGRSQMIAVNVSRRESDLTRMPPESAELWQGAPLKTGPAAAGRQQEPAKRDIWPWVLAAALIAACAELYLASRHMRLEVAA